MIYINGHRVTEIDDEVPENGEYESLRSIFWTILASPWMEFTFFIAGIAAIVFGVIRAPFWWPL